MTNEPELFRDTLDLLDAFHEAGVQFVIIGAHALAAHGIVRATGDFDVLVKPNPANARRVVRALEAFGAPLEAHQVVESDFARVGTVYQLGLPPCRIDILTGISGVSFADAWGTHITVELGERRLPVIGRDALIRNKRASGRAKDLLDVAALERDT